ncbi:hypothetical protein [Dyadobacter chenhuakuii]|uniref:RING-type E3 ubiquitin transferase n=1 Tax=Dyadobacter chenhuakuii TaxID=2909339 RepID=A0ABY4XRH7_9BACT|nr:hypothetical protein [Dyadobacter chenhuakuii]MCF2492680.1 hypothetical protein [Dyadobacter chenhuakuii]USJ33027.1 hypothetical protein NFI80_09800 [Dyadobacter chenhuakuii]
MLFKLLFPALFLTGAYFLFRSITRIVQVYAGPKIEFSAKTATNTIKIDQGGDYEIAYKRPSLTGVIPSNCTFTLIKDADQREWQVVSALNMLGMRKDLSGNRVVPIAEFNIAEPGTYTLRTTESVSFKEGDRLLITAKTGSKGFLAIFAIIISGIATIAGLVLSILAWTNRL